MQASLSDTINLGSSIITLIGAGATVVGFVRKLMISSPPSAPRANPPGAYPAPTPPASYPPVGYPPAGYPPAAGRAPIYAPVATMARKRIPHPVILGFAALALLCVVGYSLVLTYQYVQTGHTGIPVGSPLVALNGVFVTINLIAGTVAMIGLLITSARVRWGWFTAGVIGLLVMLVTIGIFSVVALVPACFYALNVYPRAAGR